METKKTYRTPDGMEFNTSFKAKRHMRLNDIPGNVFVKTQPLQHSLTKKQQDIYFIPIVALGLIEPIIKLMPEEIGEYYAFDGRWWPSDDGVLGLDILEQTQKGQYWEFIRWILMRMPESHDKPGNYFMDIYTGFKRDLKKDMEENNEGYGHKKSCINYNSNYAEIIDYWNKNTPKEGYDGTSGIKYVNQDLEKEYFDKPLYYEKTLGWGIALTFEEVSTHIIESLQTLTMRLSMKQKISPQTGIDALGYKSTIFPNRLRLLGKSEMILRPLLLTQGIFCPCRWASKAKLVRSNQSMESILLYLLDEKLLFKLNDDVFGSLKLINWPYNEPLI